MWKASSASVVCALRPLSSLKHPIEPFMPSSCPVLLTTGEEMILSLSLNTLKRNRLLSKNSQVIGTRRDKTGHATQAMCPCRIGTKAGYAPAKQRRSVHAGGWHGMRILCSACPGPDSFNTTIHAQTHTHTFLRNKHAHTYLCSKHAHTYLRNKHAHTSLRSKHAHTSLRSKHGGSAV